MKKSILFLLGIMTFGCLTAQETTISGTKFTDNWSVGLNGGIVSPLTHSAFFGNARAVVGLDINKQFTPIYGLTLESNWTINTQSRMSSHKSHTAFDAFDLMLLNRLNINNIIKPYSGEPSLFEAEVVGGFGWLRLTDWGSGGNNHLASKAGINFNFNVGQAKAWTIGIKPAIFWDMSMWDTDRAHNYPNFNANYANWEITAGVTYHFKNSNGKHYLTRVKVFDQAEFDALNATINQLRGEMNMKDENLRRTDDALRKERQKSADLEKALNDCRNQAPQVINNSQKTLESVVTFRQGSTTIDASQQPNVERVASYLKKHENMKVRIRGYASPEGSKEVNERIANQRAEAVKSMLVKKYGISESRITSEGLGVGDVFEEPDWNRVSICTIVSE